MHLLRQAPSPSALSTTAYPTAYYLLASHSTHQPMQAQVYDALPIESRTAQAMLILPDKPAEGAPCVVHLAATGEQALVSSMGWDTCSEAQAAMQPCHELQRGPALRRVVGRAGC